MKNIKITYSYDGSDFYGVQRQPKERTVQGEIEKAIKILLKKEVTLTTAGRTDRGVHASMQVSNFFMDDERTIPVENFKRAINRLLPEDIEIYNVEEVDLEFNSRYHATKRAYEYVLTWKKDIFSRRYKTYVEEEIDKDKLLDILLPLIGVHDFNNFRLKDENNRTTIREIYQIKTYLKDEDTLGVYIEGSAFLKTQIRIIIGTALEIYLGKMPKDYIELLLNEPEVSRRVVIAKPNGLYLAKIEY